MARYIERAENLARILDVNETFARNAQGVQDWLPILRLHCDEERFFDSYSQPNAANVVRFYIVDKDNPNSIRQSVSSARESARGLRHLISLEVWQQLNIFWNWVQPLTARDLNLTKLSVLCSKIKDSCELHLGLVERTMYRDQVWLFYRLGCAIERCDQTTRLVDIKYHALLPHPKDVGSPVDMSQWNAVLRSAAAYHGYRRAFPQQMTPATVSGFILFDRHFPRSISSCVIEIREILSRLQRLPELAGATFPTETVSRLEELASREPKMVLALGLHEFLDAVQLELNQLGREVSKTFFRQRRPAA